MIRTGTEVLRQALEEQAHREETMALERRLHAAAAQPGLAGDLRRAYVAARLWPEDIARDCGIDPHRFKAFLADDGSLMSEEVERLAARLGLHLVPVATPGAPD